MNVETPLKSPEPYLSNRLTRFALTVGGIIPDAMTMAIVLMVAVVGLAVLFGNTFLEIADAYYQGLWMLLPFTMQMTLILVLGSTLASTKFFRKLILTLSSLTRNRTQTLGLSMLTVAGLAYCFWGLSLALGPLVGVNFASQSERKGFAIDFPFLLSANAAAGSVWQFGLSASAPLIMNTPGHFLEDLTGLMPLSTTIFSPATLIFVPLYLFCAFGMAWLVMPKRPRPISQFQESNKLAAATIKEDQQQAQVENIKEENFAERLESNRVPWAILVITLFGWLVYHVIVKGGGLELNSLNTILLFLCLLLHGSVRNFTQALPKAVVTAWPVIVLYHLYAGVAGFIQHTSLGADFANYFASISTEYSFPLFTMLSAAVVSVFVPSSGGQWVIQGFITSKASAVVGVTAQRGLLALSIGDHVGNLISPFWAVIGAGIAKVDFRCYIGYNYLYVLLWVGIGTLCFTFLSA